MCGQMYGFVRGRLLDKSYKPNFLCIGTERADLYIYGGANINSHYILLKHGTCVLSMAGEADVNCRWWTWVGMYFPGCSGGGEERKPLP